VATPAALAGARLRTVVEGYTPESGVHPQRMDALAVRIAPAPAQPGRDTGILEIRADETPAWLKTLSATPTPGFPVLETAPAPLPVALPEPLESSSGPMADSRGLLGVAGMSQSCFSLTKNVRLKRSPIGF